MDIAFFFEKYTDSYNARDMGVVNSFLLPSVMINANRIAKFRSEQDLIAEYEFVFETMRKQGMHRFELLQLEHSQLCDNQYVASARWRACGATGECVMEFGATYGLVVESGNLKIASAMVHPQESALQFDVMKTT